MGHAKGFARSGWIAAARGAVARMAAVLGPAGLVVAGVLTGWAIYDVVYAPADVGSGVDDRLILHRGVSSVHPGYANALIGVAEPRGGNATPIEHSLGNTYSDFTSWTSDPDVAEQYALKDTGAGVILTKTFSSSDLTPGPEIMGESEFLVRGRVTGAMPQQVSR